MYSTTDVIVIGGSITGLMHALILKSLGRNVLVLEARPHEELQARAARLSLWPRAQQLITAYAPGIDMDAIAIRNQVMQIMTGDGLPLAEVPVSEDVRTPSWSVVHRLLWEACEKRNDTDGLVSFEIGKRVCAIQEQEEKIFVTYKGSNGTEEKTSTNLVVAADGARSFARSQVLPDVESQYAGYLAWRGSFSEKQASPELAGALEGKLALFIFEGSYILVYLTPSETGSTTPGERLLEWCWYDKCEASSSTFSDFMTDSNGNRHNHTVPANLLRPETWKAQLARRKGTMPPLWHQRFLSTTKDSLPLLTAIRSLDNTTASFLDGKLLLAGEAFMQIRPHLGASCSIPALQALTLAQVLKGEKTRENAGKEVLKYATKQSAGSKATGIFGMTGKWPEGYVPSFTQA